MSHDHNDFADRAHHFGKSTSFDQFDTTTYLHSDNAADGSFVEHFILQVNGFELNGSPVELPGFGTHYGMYFLIDATGVGTPAGTTFTSLNIALMVDPGNNDGTPSATREGIGFSNGTGGDFALATGTLSSAKLFPDSLDPTTRHADFVETMTPTAAGRVLFGGSLQRGALLEELLTTPLSARESLDGGAINLVNGGTGHAELVPQTSLSVGPRLLSHDGGGHGLFAADCH